MRRYLLLDGFDVETNDLDLIRCGGLFFWTSPSGDVWFWLDECFWKVSMRRSVPLELFDVEIRDLDYLFRCGGLCFWKSSIGGVWLWFHLCFWKASMRRFVLLEVFYVEIRCLDLFRCGVCVFDSLLLEMCFIGRCMW